ncbi:unnamed protein product [Rhodiola kirilowii]
MESASVEVNEEPDDDDDASDLSTNVVEESDDDHFVDMSNDLKLCPAMLCPVSKSIPVDISSTADSISTLQTKVSFNTIYGICPQVLNLYNDTLGQPQGDRKCEMLFGDLNGIEHSYSPTVCENDTVDTEQQDMMVKKFEQSVLVANCSNYICAKGIRQNDSKVLILLLPPTKPPDHLFDVFEVLNSGITMAGGIDYDSICYIGGLYLALELLSVKFKSILMRKVQLGQDYSGLKVWVNFDDFTSNAHIDCTEFDNLADEILKVIGCKPPNEFFITLQMFDNKTIVLGDVGCGNWILRGVPVWDQASKFFKEKLLFVCFEMENELVGNPVSEYFGVAGKCAMDLVILLVDSTRFMPSEKFWADFYPNTCQGVSVQDTHNQKLLTEEILAGMGAVGSYRLIKWWILFVWKEFMDRYLVLSFVDLMIAHHEFLWLSSPRPPKIVDPEDKPSILDAILKIASAWVEALFTIRPRRKASAIGCGWWVCCGSMGGDSRRSSRRPFPMNFNKDALSAADSSLPGEEASHRTSSVFVLDHVGEVTLDIDSDRLSWDLIHADDQANKKDGSVCLGFKIASKAVTEIKWSDAYAVELISWGVIHDSCLPKGLLGHESEMYRFTVHGVQRSKVQTSVLVPVVYTFGHTTLQTCEMWVNQIDLFLSKEIHRPRNLLVFVHPLSGKGNGCKTWETVAPIFSRAKVKTKVTVTQRAGHAFDVMSSSTNVELNEFDGVVAVGGDGLFNEVLNGLLGLGHFPYPPAPTDFIVPVEDDEPAIGTSGKDDASSPLLATSTCNGSGLPNSVDQGPEFYFPNERFKFGIIPSGSTDAIVICTTGSRDPITSAMHIVLGKEVRLDIAQVVRWKTTLASKVEPCVRYAASFAGYGFYGDVITESDKYRWMGPKRYDYAGTKNDYLFLDLNEDYYHVSDVSTLHEGQLILIVNICRSYEAEVRYLDVKSENDTYTFESTADGTGGNRKRNLWGGRKNKKVICCANCEICNFMLPPCGKLVSLASCSQEARWLRSKGRFLSVGAAVISCRNQRAPDGLVADAHLADGFLDLILIKDCPHALYLWHLTQLTRKGGTPLDFDFVEHHKTPAFTFTSSSDESVWNLDGEAFQAHQLSAQVFRGLVTLFAPGPEEK